MLKSNDPKNLIDFIDNKVSPNVDSMEFRTEYNDNYTEGYEAAKNK